jgi:hypothetical protein
VTAEPDVDIDKTARKILDLIWIYRDEPFLFFYMQKIG